MLRHCRIFSDVVGLDNDIAIVGVQFSSGVGVTIGNTHSNRPNIEPYPDGRPRDELFTEVNTFAH